MYFSKNNTLDKFQLYLSFLADIASNGNKKYEAIFESIFKDVKKLANGEIDYSSVPSETFDIVSIFAFNNSEYFKTLKIEELDLEHYKKIHSLLQEDIKQLV